MKKFWLPLPAFFFLTPATFSQTEAEPNNYFAQANTCAVNTAVNMTLSQQAAWVLSKFSLYRKGFKVKLNNIPTAGFYGLPVRTLFIATKMLPLNRFAFLATIKTKQINLFWQTASKFDTSHFVAQRSTNSSAFLNIGSV